MVLKIGKNELKIKFLYEPTVKSRIISRLAKMEPKLREEGTMENIEEILMLVPELILIGIQKRDSDEYKYDYDTGEGKEEQLSKIYGMLDEYFEMEDSDFMTLYSSLQNELLKDGFLRSLFQKEQAEVKKSRKLKAVPAAEDSGN